LKLNKHKFGRIVLPVNMHQLTELDYRCFVTLSRWRPWRHFPECTAIWGVYSSRSYCWCLPWVTFGNLA